VKNVKRCKNPDVHEETLNHYWMIVFGAITPFLDGGGTQETPEWVGVGVENGLSTHESILAVGPFRHPRPPHPPPPHNYIIR